MNALTLRLYLLASSLVLFGAGCSGGYDCSAPNAFIYPDGTQNEDALRYCQQQRTLKFRNDTTETVLVFATMPGDGRNENSNYQKAQSEAPFDSFDMSTSATVEPGNTATIMSPDIPGAQAGAITVDSNGGTLRTTLAGTNIPSGNMGFAAADRNIFTHQDPLLIRFGGADGEPPPPLPPRDGDGPNNPGGPAAN